MIPASSTGSGSADPELVVKEAVAGLDTLVSKLTAKDGPFPLAEEEVLHWGTKQKYPCFQDGPNSLVLHTLPDLYRDSFFRNVDKTCLTYEVEEVWTYGDVHRHAAALARTLAADYGIKHGDCIAVAGRNTPDWVISLMAGTGFLGCMVLPVNSWWVDEELRYGLEDSGAKILLADSFVLDRAGFLGEIKVPAILMRGEAKKGLPPGTRTLKDLVSSGLQKPPLPMLPVGKDDHAMLMYTSGTTSNPKGVVMTHRGVMTAMNGYRMLQYSTEWAAQPSLLLGSPLFHATGSHVGFFGCLCLGAKLNMMYKWDPTKALQVIQDHRVNSIVGVPTMTYELANHPDLEKYDTSSLTAVGGGGSQFAAPMIKRVNDKLKTAKASTGYGLTETNAISVLMPGQLFPFRPTSCGLPLCHTKVVVLDENNKQLGPNQMGELCLNSAAIMKEYWGKPDKTEEAFHVDEEGRLLFRSGDLGIVDDQGFVHILDRAKDLIIRGGENISCSEVETAVFEHPSVAEVAAVGMPDTKLGEVVAVAVVVKAGSKAPSAEELKAEASKKLAGFKVPSEVHFWPEESLPRGATGKIQKREIRDLLKDKRETKSKL